LTTLNISKENIMEDLMKELEKLYEKPSAFNKVFVMKQLFNMNMSECRYVADHLE
jgi:glucose-6-phosphate isomerase